MTTFGVDPLVAELETVLGALAGGSYEPGDETVHVDLKEEAGRRERGGHLGPSQPRNDEAAKALASEAACMANTPLGGYLVVGAADDGALIGTDLDVEWLRHRIYELTDRRLTVAASERTVGGVRLLALLCPEAVEPIRMSGRINWRVGTNCVEVDASTWHQRHLQRMGWDWSDQPSGLPASAARSSALERARWYLKSSGEEHAAGLAALDDRDLLGRLNVVNGDGVLSNAGVVAFVGRDVPAVDYIRRDRAGGDSVTRVRESNRGLIEDLYDVEQAIRAANPLRHLPSGFATGQMNVLPPLAIREAIVNGCVHRDWQSANPTLVEHVGPTLVVTSPGGFVGGVTPANIITHPSEPRNRALAELFARLRVAEREGVGFDRMVRDMIRLGHEPPIIEEVDGPQVRAVLLGNLVDEGWIRFLSRIEPDVHNSDLNSLLLLRRLADHRWADELVSAPLLQRNPVEARAALSELSRATIQHAHLTEPVDGTPDQAPPAWHLSAAALAELAEADKAAGYRRQQPDRRAIARDWAISRGRISTTELASIVGASATNVGSVLKRLEADGTLRPGRDGRQGAGFFYVPATK